ncbi:alkaline phosphatase [Stieleria sp. TO1_6]|uniref:alkaline phosphatase n=1 Tax=Stieleria tagensis TaxID=2956795 RepID=UPI00209ACA96|nr:alkaline phosphatase [Stieleria tagensis]MCO8121489.1 alkaline phosphatase [Stieleria tagensis]
MLARSQSDFRFRRGSQVAQLDWSSRLTLPLTSVVRCRLRIMTAMTVLSAGIFSATVTTADQPEHAEANADNAAVAVETDLMKRMQKQSIVTQKPVYGHWGPETAKFSSWTSHSNRLIPVYTFGMTLNKLREQGSIHSDPERLQRLSGQPPEPSLNPLALYHDQTDVYRLQKAAVDAGCTNIILMVFDGMDWETTRAAAIYHSGRVGYDSGRGTGLAFQDDRRVITDFGLICTSPAAKGAKVDVDVQRVLELKQGTHLGFDNVFGGRSPWHERVGGRYLIGGDRIRSHTVTDSASSATSLCSGIKTFNGSINVAVDGTQVVPIGRQLQSEQDFKVGVVTSVPVSHATPAAAYANNVTRKDYQDISRDLVGLPSSAHRDNPLPGVDVLIGGGWGEGKKEDKSQGNNFAQGNPYFHQDDIRASDLQNGGRYRVVQRAKGQPGRESLLAAAQTAADNSERLLGFYGTKGGHLPFQTADGQYDPTIDVKSTEMYSADDISENPTLADMTEAALMVLEQSIDGFWLLVEAGDVDWANHANNLDSSIGAVISGEKAFLTVMDWVDRNAAWDHTAVIVTSDHGHYLFLDDPSAVAEAGKQAQQNQRDSGN